MTSNKISNILWSGNYCQRVLQFYQCDEQSILPIRYGLYSLSLDRFMLVDGLDLWCIEHAAKLLSSKFATIVCIFAVKPPPFGVNDSINWSIVNKVRTLPVIQTPEAYVIFSDTDLIYEGPPVDFMNQMEKITDEQAFAYFVLKIVTAAKLTNFVIGSESGINNINQDFYIDLFENEKKIIYPALDKAGWKKNFLTDISQIIYRSQNITEILYSFKKLLSESHLNQPIFNYKKIYLDYFFASFNWDPNCD